MSSKKTTTMTGFEPARAEHNALAGHLLNHSDTLSMIVFKDKLTNPTVPARFELA